MLTSLVPPLTPQGAVAVAESELAQNHSATRTPLLHLSSHQVSPRPVPFEVLYLSQNDEARLPDGSALDLSLFDAVFTDASDLVPYHQVQGCFVVDLMREEPQCE